ncbi:MAG: hypothetical protein ACD_7C00143G0006 [uncultured bacterium]|nr:MAG: hypothetical protein ACD_7C00143G0006 [uncultured bacterium]KKP67263.1 MAG: hypothetical protein UR66_C0018G0003 [Candidatus Moranbacteria bacterium GW2011_GWE1_35_17]KKP81196.1 MAG: hypothetical protein UR82_C0070G0009 [Candidatus Moranbacteria bacterium GW2011_GWF1_35_5]KKP83534.1 MAG: hypothetical protein UR83_C0035G0011 [Candidatus Moranbacteria bacterium GW2011_GWF2_35_54]HBR79821.1 hypothetical protein [Candidatus Moranbacteria bacterium]
MPSKVSDKNKKESKKSYGKDEVLVMFESLRDDISILAEGQQAIKDELTEFKGEMYSFKDEMYTFKEETNNNFEVLRNDLDNFKEETNNNFKAMFEYLSRMEDDVAEIKAELNSKKDSEKISKKWMNEIEKRLSQLEKKLVDKRISALKQKYKA